jgi:hypothetical protein
MKSNRAISAARLVFGPQLMHVFDDAVSEEP